MRYHVPVPKPHPILGYTSKVTLKTTLGLMFIFIVSSSYKNNALSQGQMDLLKE